MATIGFVTHPAAEDDIYAFAKQNARLVEKIIITKTDSKKFDSLVDKKDILPSITEKEDAMVQRVLEGKIAAVFFFHPLPQHANLIHELAHACSKRKVHLALTSDTGDCIIGRIGSTLPLFALKILFLYLALPLLRAFFQECGHHFFPILAPRKSATILKIGWTHCHSK